MIVKQSDDRSPHIAQLEELLEIVPADKKSTVAAELRALRAGMKGERDSSYLIDFDYGNSHNWVVIHDLRLEMNDRVAQIDHLMVNRMLHVFVLETKHFHAGVKITDEGEFLRWNSYNKTYEGMPSPLAQNERHITVLKEAFSSIELPTRLGMRLSPTYHSYVLVSPSARVVRPNKFDTSPVIKADALHKTIDTYFDSFGVLGAFGSQDLSILYGKYGYYFKCQSCGGNTPIKVGCGQTGHKERLRKDGYRFFRECTDCGTSILFHVNPQDEGQTQGKRARDIRYT